MKYARLDQTNRVVEIMDLPEGKTPSDYHNATVAAMFIECPENVEHGWMQDGETWNAPAVVKIPIALGVLTHDRWAIPADSTSIITLTYTANEAVCFVVNDEIHVVEPIDQVATLEITADAVGPIRVEVRGQTLVLAATEVS